VAYTWCHLSIVNSLRYSFEKIKRVKHV